MKQRVINTCVIGLVAVVVVSAAHARGWLLPLEAPLQNWAGRGRELPAAMGSFWQVLLLLTLSLGVAWLTFSTNGKHRVAWLVLGITAELLALLWICSLYGVLFQPVPCILGVVLSYAGVIGLLAWMARPRKPKPEPLIKPVTPTPRSARPATTALIVTSPAKPPTPVPPPAMVLPPVAPPKSVEAFAPPPVTAAAPAPVLPPRKPVPVSEMTIAPRVKPAPEIKPIPRVIAPEVKPAEGAKAIEANFQGEPRALEATVLVCDLADKYDLADNAEPAAATEAARKFIDRVTERLTNAGAYVHRADGEGVVALFGFPEAVPQHAENAVRAAFDLVGAWPDDANGSNGETAGGLLHVGVSSGWLVGARAGARSETFILGEAIELARRFCVANRFYGSRILIGPRTFEMADHAVVARPIDFLSGVTAQERHEIYEPLALAANAPAELLARRDSFWNGVVLYREKRWAEAYAAFQQARGDGAEEDAPLNLYLRRLEPLALHYMES